MNQNEMGLITECINSQIFWILIASIGIGLLRLARDFKQTHVSHHPMTTVGTPRKPII